MSSNISLTTPIVSVKWLQEHLNADNLIILDGTIVKSFDALQQQIPNARFFDIKLKFSDTSDAFPSACPTASQFQKEARKLGINQNSAIVVYDDKGIYSSARVWYLLRAFGFNNVAVLNGGFPEWLKSGYATEETNLYEGGIGDFEANLQPNFMKFFDDIEANSKNETHKIIDARSSGRFNCKEPEPTPIQLVPVLVIKELKPIPILSTSTPICANNAKSLKLATFPIAFAFKSTAPVAPV